jgi:hypothetical protein
MDNRKDNRNETDKYLLGARSAFAAHARHLPIFGLSGPKAERGHINFFVVCAVPLVIAGNPEC